MIITLLFLSFFGAFFSGLLGVGGAVLLIPLLLTVPTWLGVGVLSMHEVAGLTMLQVLAASISGWLAHRKGGAGHLPTTFSIGIPMGVFSFVGAVVSRLMPENGLMLVFGCLVIFAFFMLLKGNPDEAIETNDFEFKRLLSVISGVIVGFVAGMIGAGGGFILIPVMLKVLKLPVRVAVSSSLGVVFIGALMGSLGKIVSLQVEWLYLLPVVAGSIPGSLLGARVSRCISPTRIRHLLLLLVFLIMIKTLFDLIF